MSSNTYFKTDRKSLATEINENFLNNLNLDAQEIEELTKRGLKQQFFTQAGYKTWQNGKNTQSAKAVSKIDSSYNLTGHPGFSSMQMAQEPLMPKLGCSFLSEILVAI